MVKLVYQLVRGDKVIVDNLPTQTLAEKLQYTIRKETGEILLITGVLKKEGAR